MSGTETRCLQAGCEKPPRHACHRHGLHPEFHSFKAPAGTRWSDYMGGVVCNGCGHYADYCTCHGAGNVF